MGEVSEAAGLDYGEVGLLRLHQVEHRFEIIPFVFGRTEAVLEQLAEHAGELLVVHVERLVVLQFEEVLLIDLHKVEEDELVVVGDLNRLENFSRLGLFSDADREIEQAVVLLSVRGLLSQRLP